MSYQYVGKKIKNIVYIDDRGYVSKATKILETVGNLRLIGETGVGKTTLIYKLAESFNTPLFECVLTRDTSRWDLVASDTLKKGETVIRKGIIIAWLESKGGILSLNGFNYAEPNIVSLVESLADFRGVIYVPELQKEYKRSDKHYLIIDYNPSEKAGYSGTFIENIATIRRFEGIVIDYLGVLKETKHLQKYFNEYEWCRKIVELASKTRTLYKLGKFNTPITTGNLINYAKLRKAGMDDTEIIEIASSLFKESQRESFKRLFEDVKKESYATD